MLGFIGFMLSPLSWWNDLFVNVPLAIAFAWVISLFYKPAFEVACVVGYWLTNVLGLVLMHKAAQRIVAADELPKRYSRSDLLRDVAIDLGQTITARGPAHDRDANWNASFSRLAFSARRQRAFRRAAARSCKSTGARCRTL